MRILLPVLLASCAEATIDPLQLPGREPSSTARFRLDLQRTPQDAQVDAPLTQVWLEVREGDALHTDPLPVTLRAVRGRSDIPVATVESAAGIATFPSFALSQPGEWVVVASAPDAASATSPPFTISGVGEVLRLRFDTQPQDTASNRNLPDVLVSIVDAAGQIVPVEALISLEWMRGDVTVGNPTSARTARGTATFRRLSTQAWGTGFTLRVYTPDYGSLRSDPFDVVPGDVVLSFDRTPPSAVRGAPIVPIEVEVRPRRSGAGPWLTDEITLSGPDLSGTLTARAVAGRARFDDVRSSSPDESIVLVAHGPDRSLARSEPIRLRPPPARVLLPDGSQPFAATAPSLSHDGRFLALVLSSPRSSGAPVQGVYIVDRTLGSTMLASITPRGAPGNGWESDPHITADGRYLAWTSGSSDFIPADVNGGAEDVFGRDLDDHGSVALVGLLGAGQPPRGANIQGEALSDDHQWLVFTSSDRPSGNPAVYVRDLQAATTTSIGYGLRPSISGNGLVVVLDGNASLARDDDGEVARHVMAIVRPSGRVEHLCVHRGAAPAPSYSRGARISQDGRFVAFTSNADDLVPDDTNGTWDVFVHDRQNDFTSRVSVSSNGEQAHPTPGRLPQDRGTVGSNVLAMSADARFVVFVSTANNLVDDRVGGGLFVRDRANQRTGRVTFSEIVPDDTAIDAAISGDGRFIAVTTGATNVVPGDTNGQPDTFVVTNPLWP